MERNTGAGGEGTGGDGGGGLCVCACVGRDKLKVGWMDGWMDVKVGSDLKVTGHSEMAVTHGGRQQAMDREGK